MLALTKQTMSLSEIAHLTDKPVGEVSFDFNDVCTEMGWQFHTDLTENEALLLVSGYSAVLRNRIIEEWAKYKTGGHIKDPVIAALTHSLMEIDTLKHRMDALETRSDSGYMTVLAWSKSRGLRLPVSSAKLLGLRARRYCTENDIEVGRVPDERLGEVNSYPREVLDELY